MILKLRFIKYITMAAIFISFSAVNAQNSISGTTKDSSGEPLAGVTISIKDSKKGESSDFDGNFTINNLENATYTFIASYIGFKTVEKQVVIDGKDIKNLAFVLDEDFMALDAIVITASGNPRTKLESSIAITTIGAKQIEEQAPNSTADLLQSIPGFLVENSAGEIGNNLFARGIPSAGAYEYVQFQEDGLPVFEDGALQFANVDTFQRLDATTKTVEAVKGGTASIYATGAPGGIINFVSNTGQNEFKGIAKVTTGDFGLIRTDFNLGGSIVEDKLFFNIGGFYREDDGIRDTGFKANRGGQFKFNMTYKFDKGYARINYKKLNDRNVFYQSTPFVWDNGKAKAYAGFDANFGTLTSVNFSKIKVPQGNGGYFEANLEDGSHPIVDAIGAEFKYDLTDKITVKNAFKSTIIDLNYNAIFAAQWMGDVSSQADFATNNGWSDVQFTNDNNGAVLDASTELKRADLWYIKKDMNNFANNLSFNFDLGKTNLNIGHYYSNWSSAQNWNWSSLVVSAATNPQLVNAVNTVSGEGYTYNGISGISWLQRESTVRGTVNAIFADADIEASEKLNFNIGFRYDNDKYSGFGDHGTWGNDIGVLPNNTADNGVNILTGNYVRWDYDVNELSYSLAANYKFNNNTASYIRHSKGFRAPIEESFYAAVESGEGNAALEGLNITEVTQTELGFKYSGDHIAVFANAFYMQLDKIAYQDIQAGGLAERKFANVKNLGLELETIFNYGNFDLAFNGTLQNPEYADFEGSQESNNGNIARRISKFYFNVRPSYNFTKAFNLYAKYSYFGSKFQDIENTFEIPSFGVVNAGASYSLDNIRFGLDASNLFNTIALTEADGIAAGGVPANGQTFMGRSILGRAVKLSIAINF
ncbi:MAG: iron complex outermembrane receptor protein [Polaribacter sp.]|jgi:iron complex outermembrane receptor protein